MDGFRKLYIGGSAHKLIFREFLISKLVVTLLQ